jgi:dTDP-4-amino-4,6-dideoxygalactose transaminase
MGRIYLSPPHQSGLELEFVENAIASNWIAPLGPHVDEFEHEIANLIEVPYAVALSSGTAALHLAARLADIKRGEEIICPSLTFSASVNAVVYEGARPVFIDCDASSWNMDPDLLAEELRHRARVGPMPGAVIVVDLYGQSADYDRIVPLCEEYAIPLIEDAAEALGATYKGRPVGRFGQCAAFSFNGNKIITTSGGGMLVSQDEELIRKARFLATQARDPASHYQHSTIGYNYRLSNILAAIGRAQLRVLSERVEARRKIFDTYVQLLEDLPGVEFMPEAPYGRSTRWLTCLTIDPEAFGATREDVRRALEAEDIEARPVWKPMHLQPVFKDCTVRGRLVSEQIFERGLCLPSGSAMSREQVEHVSSVVRRSCPAAAKR